jgi:hypothetical protein
MRQELYRFFTVFRFGRYGGLAGFHFGAKKKVIESEIK